MRDWKFVAFVFLLFIAGYFNYMRGAYPPAEALLLSFIAVGLIYLIPFTLVNVIQSRNHSLIEGVLVATIWELVITFLLKISGSLLWKNFLWAGYGGALLAVVLVCMSNKKEGIAENSCKVQS